MTRPDGVSGKPAVGNYRLWLLGAIAFVVSAPVAGLSIRALAHAVPEIIEAWWSGDASKTGYGRVGASTTRDGKSQGASGVEAWGVRDVIVRACIPTGLVVAAVLGIAGTALGRRRMVIAGAVVMLAETLVVFTIVPLTLLAGVTFAVIAKRLAAG